MTNSKSTRQMLIPINFFCLCYLLKSITLLSTVHGFSNNPQHILFHPTSAAVRLTSFATTTTTSTTSTASSNSVTQSTTTNRASTFHRMSATENAGNEQEVSNNSNSSNNNNNSEDDDGLLNDVDARVLQSMLQDTKLNLQDEENMKRLLERGVKKETPRNAERGVQAQKEKEEVPYSSKVLQTLGNTKLWKGLSRNAADIFESAKIWAQNKVERDAKLVASLGIFAFERALKDVSRALPAAGSVAKKVAPKLSLPETSSAATSEDIRSQMTTPADEFQSVANELRLILTSGGEKGGGMAVTARGLKSTATSKTGNNRFLKAYQRQKQTTLKRERENLVQTSTRMAGSVMNSAYQVQRELQVEPNQPGYKTKAIRDSAAQTSKLLASGAKGILSGAKAVAQAALPSNAAPPPTPNVLPSDRSIPNDTIDSSVADGYTNFAKRTPQVSDAPVNARIPGNSVNSDISALYEAPSAPTQEIPSDDLGSYAEDRFFFASRSAPNFEEEINAGTPVDDIPDDFAFETRPFTQEDQYEGIVVDPENMANAFFAQPSSTPSAFANGFVSEVNAEIVELTPDYTSSRTAPSTPGGSPSFFTSSEDIQTADVSVDPASLFDFQEQTIYGDEDDIVLPDEDPQDTLRRVRAEIVTDEDFEIAIGKAKEVDNTAGKEVDFVNEEEKEPGVFTVVSLRLLDVIFLILEKVVLALPGALSMVPIILGRASNAQSAGMGSVGWELLTNAQRGDRRY